MNTDTTAVLTGQLIISQPEIVTMADDTNINQAAIDAATAAGSASSTTAAPAAQQTTAQQNNALFAQNLAAQNVLFQQQVTQQAQMFQATMVQQTQLFQQTMAGVIAQQTAVSNNNLLAFYAGSGAITVIP